MADNPFRHNPFHQGSSNAANETREQRHQREQQERYAALIQRRRENNFRIAIHQEYQRITNAQQMGLAYPPPDNAYLPTPPTDIHDPVHQTMLEMVSRTDEIANQLDIQRRWNIIHRDDSHFNDLLDDASAATHITTESDRIKHECDKLLYYRKDPCMTQQRRQRLEETFGQVSPDQAMQSLEWLDDTLNRAVLASGSFARLRDYINRKMLDR